MKIVELGSVCQVSDTNRANMVFWCASISDRETLYWCPPTSKRMLLLSEFSGFIVRRCFFAKYTLQPGVRYSLSLQFVSLTVKYLIEVLGLWSCMHTCGLSHVVNAASVISHRTTFTHIKTLFALHINLARIRFSCREATIRSSGDDDLHRITESLWLMARTQAVEMYDTVRYLFVSIIFSSVRWYAFQTLALRGALWYVTYRF